MSTHFTLGEDTMHVYSDLIFFFLSLRVFVLILYGNKNAIFLVANIKHSKSLSK